MTGHGTLGGYIRRRCPCQPCREAGRSYRRRQYRRAGYGQPTTDLVAAAPVRAHVNRLLAAGASAYRIAQLAGVRPTTVARLVGPAQPTRRLRPATAAALLAVRYGDVKDPALPAGTVPAGPVWDSVHGIVAAGYPLVWVARQLGQKGAMVQLGRQRVSARHADKIVELVEYCALNPGPSNRARVFAARQGWTVDLLWQHFPSNRGRVA